MSIEQSANIMLRLFNKSINEKDVWTNYLIVCMLLLWVHVHGKTPFWLWHNCYLKSQDKNAANRQYLRRQLVSIYKFRNTNAHHCMYLLIHPFIHGRTLRLYWTTQMLSWRQCDVYINKCIRHSYYLFIGIHIYVLSCNNMQQSMDWMPYPCVLAKQIEANV